jgi:hypothetical protein
MCSCAIGTYSFRRRGPVRIAEFWFNEGTSCAADIARFLHVASCVASARCTPDYTLVIDLEADEDTLLTAMAPDARSKVRRAARDGAVANFWRNPDDKVVRQFSAFYDQFARQKNLPPVSGAALRALRQSGLLAISNVAAPSGEALVWHSYVWAGPRVRLLQSASLFRSFQSSAERNAIGRANRFLHYKDMLAFKAAGARLYDFGGWYPGGTDAELIRINRFKEEFGGNVELRYNCERGVTLLGKCALVVRRFVFSLAAGAKRALLAFTGFVRSIMQTERKVSRLNGCKPWTDIDDFRKIQSL